MIRFDVMVTNETSALHCLHATSGRAAHTSAGRDRNTETSANMLESFGNALVCVQTQFRNYGANITPAFNVML